MAPLYEKSLLPGEEVRFAGHTHSSLPSVLCHGSITRMLLIQSTSKNTQSLQQLLLWTQQESKVAATPPHRVKQGLHWTTSDTGWGEATDPTAIHFWSTSNSKRFQEAARIPTFDCMLGVNAAQLFKNVHMHEWKEQKELETQRGWRAVQLQVSHHLHAKREPWARKILTREHSDLQNTEHNMRRMHILQPQLLANSGETHASRLAWLDRSGSVTCGGVLQEAEVSRDRFSHTVLPDYPIRWKTNKGFMFGNQNQLITEHCFQLKALVWE